MEGAYLTPLKIIKGEKGNVMHALKKSESSFHGLGEVYFSTVNFKERKGWKKHTRMVLNLVVVSGAIRFMIFNPATKQQQDFVLGPEVNYSRLTVPAGLWMAFEGSSEEINMLVNIASIEHDPTEAESLPLENEIIPQF